MLPRSTSHDHVDSACPYAERLPNLGKREFPSRIALANLANLILGQLGKAVTRTTANMNSLSALRHAIRVVVLNSSKKEVGRVHTSPVITRMADQHSLRDGSDVEGVRLSMGKSLTMPTIPIQCPITQPFPTGVRTIRRINPLPESLLLLRRIATNLVATNKNKRLAMCRPFGLHNWRPFSTTTLTKTNRNSRLRVHEAVLSLSATTSAALTARGHFVTPQVYNILG